jgi:hypothetical protein
MLDNSKVIIGTKVHVIELKEEYNNNFPYHTIKDMEGKYFILCNGDEYKGYSLELYDEVNQ